MERSSSSLPGSLAASLQTKREARIHDLRYTKFKLQGIDGEKHAVLVPDHLMLPASVFLEVCAVLGKDPPALFLNAVSSMCHPGRMSTAPLRACSDFQHLTYAAKRSTGRQRGPEGEAVSSVVDNSRVEVDLVNALLEKKLVSAVAKVTTAAQRSNVWTFSGPQLTNFEILLQQVLESKATDVFRLTAAHMQDRSYMESEASRALMKALFSSSTELGSDVVGCCPVSNLPGELWNPSTSSNDEFSQHGYETWSFHSLDQSSSSGHPVTLWPWPHADLFLLFFHEETTAGPGEVEVDWQYKTGRRLDLEACSFNLEQVAPSGHVFIGEPICLQAHMKKKIIHAIKHSIPTVILDNTPNVAKQMSLLLNVINRVWDKAPVASCKPFLIESLAAALDHSPKADQLLHALSPSLILHHVENSFDRRGMDPDEKLALSDVVGLLEVAKRQPHAFRHSVVVLDPLGDDVEDTPSRLQSVLSSHQGKARSTAKEATLLHQAAALRGWSFHIKLVSYADTLDKTFKGFVAGLGALSLLVATIALLACDLYLRGVQNSNGRVVHLALLFLPSVLGLLMVAQSNLNLELRWACVHMTSNRVVSEIFQLLGSTGPYKLAAPVANQKKFFKRLGALMSNLSAAGVLAEEIGGKFSDNFFEHDSTGLDEHINYNLYGVSPPSWLGLQIRGLINSWSAHDSGFPWTALLPSCPEHKEWASALTGEKYMDLRVTPLRQHYSRWVRRVGRAHALLRFLALLCLAAAVLVAGLGCWTAVPVLLGLATLVTQFVQQFAPQELIVVLNRALTELNTIELRWHGADQKEKRSAATRERLISVTEKASLMVAKAFSQAALLGEIDFAETEDNVEDESEDWRGG